MQWLAYLYYKYLRFQQRVGNADIAPWSAALIIAWLISFTVLDGLLVAGYLVDLPHWKPLPIAGVISFVVLGAACCWVFGSGKRYASIVERYEHEDRIQRRRGTLFASLWPLLLFVIFGTMMVLFARAPIPE